MITGVVAKQISRTNRNLLITNLVLLAILVGIAALSMNVLRNFFAGPLPMTMEEVAAIQDPSSVARYWVHVKLEPQQLDQEIIEHESGGRNSTTTYYHFYHLKNGLVIISASSTISASEFDAVIGGQDSEITNEVLPKTDLEGPFLPVTLHIEDFRIGVFIGAPIWLAFLGMALWNLSKARARMSDPLKHPVAVALARFGPPEEIAVAVDAEMQTSANTTGNVVTTTSWLMRPTMFFTDLIFLGDVVWAYMKQTKHKSYGVTTNTTYATVICDRHGGQLEVPMKMAQVQQLLVDIRRAVPWAIIGFDQKLTAQWSKKSRPQFLQMIDQRKQQYEAQQAAGPTPPPIQQ
jgi:hypothetical protein